MNQASGEYVKWLEQNRLTYDQELMVKKEIDDFHYKPLISIILPVYNMNRSWLDQAVESVKNQLYNNWELCIVDDGSDNKETITYLTSIEPDPEIKVKFRADNGHICNATNDAVGMSKGEFLVFLDHDDILTR